MNAPVAMLNGHPSPFDRDGLQYAWDSTSLGWAQTCLRKYQYYMIDGWKPIGGSIHLEFGIAYATALEHFHKHLASGQSHDEALQAIVHEALVNTWEFSWDHPTKTRGNLIRTIIWYVDHFKDDPCKTVILSSGEAAVEYSFSFELGPDALYCGHIDRLVEYAGELYVQDQKTTGSTIAPRYWNQFNPNTQMSGYTVAGQIVYGPTVKGVMIDAAQIAVGFSRFERGFTFRTGAQLEEWKKDAQMHIASARQATAEGYFPQNPTSCDKYGGCEFRSVCSQSPENRENYLRADFAKRKLWNPLEPR